jgi:hypothetical protein
MGSLRLPVMVSAVENLSMGCQWTVVEVLIWCRGRRNDSVLWPRSAGANGATCQMAGDMTEASKWCPTAKEKRPRYRDVRRAKKAFSSG